LLHESTCKQAQIEEFQTKEKPSLLQEISKTGMALADIEIELRNQAKGAFLYHFW
jgi:hypothetical protein